MRRDSERAVTFRAGKGTSRGLYGRDKPDYPFLGRILRGQGRPERRGQVGEGRLRQDRITDGLACARRREGHLDLDPLPIGLNGNLRPGFRRGRRSPHAAP